MERKEKLKSAIKIGIELFLLYELSNGAFSRKVRKWIKNRAGGRSELSGRREKRMQCSHDDHDKKSSKYNCRDTGTYLCLSEHYVYHESHQGEAEKIGLTEEENNSAIGGLRGQLEKDYGVEEASDRIQRAREDWRLLEERGEDTKDLHEASQLFPTDDY